MKRSIILPALLLFAGCAFAAPAKNAKREPTKPPFYLGIYNFRDGHMGGGFIRIHTPVSAAERKQINRIEKMLSGMALEANEQDACVEREKEGSE